MLMLNIYHLILFCVCSNIIQAHLENVHDIQSKISVLTWWAGSSLGDDDIFVEEATYSHTVFQNYLNTSLPEGTTVFVSVKACNNAGMLVYPSLPHSFTQTNLEVGTLIDVNQ